MFLFSRKVILSLTLLLILPLESIGQKKKSFHLSDKVPAEKTIRNRYHRSSLSGNIKQIGPLLSEKRSCSPKIQKLFEKYTQRFITRTEKPNSSGDSFVDEVLTAFRQYWADVLMQKTDSAQGSTDLDSSLIKINAKYGLKRSDNPSAAIKNEFRKRGYYLLTGVTSPYKELMVWKSQTETTYSVQLTDVKQDLTVVVLNDFVSLGWLGFASFGMHHTGGWATKVKLFAVAPSYDIGSESFKVSYLKHEARHLVDNRLYPSLKGVQLEYRAKLTELVYADKNISKLLENFIVGANKNSHSPHPKANFEVIRALSSAVFGKTYEEDVNEWKKIDTSVIQATARKLLKANTKQLQANDR